MMKGDDATGYQPQRRIERALIAAAIVAVLAVAAMTVGGVAFWNERRDAQCFRTNQARLALIAAEDRRVQDVLFAGFAVFVDTLAHPTPHTVQHLFAELATYKVARARDDRERAAHPITGTC